MRCLHCAYQWRTGSVLHTSIDSIGKSEITTIEAIGKTAVGAKIRRLADREVVQCGYASRARSCRRWPYWRASRIRRMSISTTNVRNICRCGTMCAFAKRQACRVELIGGIPRSSITTRPRLPACVMFQTNGLSDAASFGSERRGRRHDAQPQSAIRNGEVEAADAFVPNAFIRIERDWPIVLTMLCRDGPRHLPPFQC